MLGADIYNTNTENNKFEIKWKYVSEKLYILGIILSCIRAILIEQLGFENSGL